MVSVTCDNEDCEDFGKPMEVVDEDDRGEWYECHYECAGCKSKKTHRREFDQIGLVTKDEIRDE